MLEGDAGATGAGLKHSEHELTDGEIAAHTADYGIKCRRRRRRAHLPQYLLHAGAEGAGLNRQEGKPCSGATISCGEQYRAWAAKAPSQSGIYHRASHVSAGE